MRYAFSAGMGDAVLSFVPFELTAECLKLFANKAINSTLILDIEKVDSYIILKQARRGRCTI